MFSFGAADELTDVGYMQASLQIYLDSKARSRLTNGSAYVRIAFLMTCVLVARKRENYDRVDVVCICAAVATLRQVCLFAVYYIWCYLFWNVTAVCSRESQDILAVLQNHGPFNYRVSQK